MKITEGTAEHPLDLSFPEQLHVISRHASSSYVIPTSLVLRYRGQSRELSVTSLVRYIDLHRNASSSTSSSAIFAATSARSTSHLPSGPLTDTPTDRATAPQLLAKPMAAGGATPMSGSRTTRTSQLEGQIIAWQTPSQAPGHPGAHPLRCPYSRFLPLYPHECALAVLPLSGERYLIAPLRPLLYPPSPVAPFFARCETCLDFRVRALPYVDPCTHTTATLTATRQPLLFYVCCSAADFIVSHSDLWHWLHMQVSPHVE